MSTDLSQILLAAYRFYHGFIGTEIRALMWSVQLRVDLQRSQAKEQTTEHLVFFTYWGFNFLVSRSFLMITCRIIDHCFNFFDYPAYKRCLPSWTLSTKLEFSFSIDFFYQHHSQVDIYIVTNTSQRCILLTNLQLPVFKQDTPRNYKAL